MARPRPPGPASSEASNEAGKDHQSFSVGFSGRAPRPRKAQSSYLGLTTEREGLHSGLLAQRKELKTLVPQVSCVLAPGPRWSGVGVGVRV